MRLPSLDLARTVRGSEALVAVESIPREWPGDSRGTPPAPRNRARRVGDAGVGADLGRCTPPGALASSEPASEKGTGSCMRYSARQTGAPTRSWAVVQRPSSDCSIRRVEGDDVRRGSLGALERPADGRQAGGETGRGWRGLTESSLRPSRGPDGTLQQQGTAPSPEARADGRLATEARVTVRRRAARRAKACQHRSRGGARLKAGQARTVHCLAACALSAAPTPRQRAATLRELCRAALGIRPNTSDGRAARPARASSARRTSAAPAMPTCPCCAARAKTAAGCSKTWSTSCETTRDAVCGAPYETARLRSLCVRGWVRGRCVWSRCERWTSRRLTSAPGRSSADPAPASDRACSARSCRRPRLCRAWRRWAGRRPSSATGDGPSSRKAAYVS